MRLEGFSGVSSAPLLPRDPSSSLPILTGPHAAICRTLLLALLFAAELTVLSVWLDNASLAQRPGLTGLIHDGGPWVLRGMVGFAALFLTFAYLQNRPAFDRMAGQLTQARFGWGLLTAHTAAILIFAWASSILYGSGAGRGDLLAFGWLVAGISAIAFAGFAFLPWNLWVQLARSTGPLGAYALIGTVAACVVGSMSRLLWEPASQLTFTLVKAFLTPFLSGIVADPARLIIGTPVFRVNIAPECSGLEGIALIVVFSAMALLLFRRECRFPQALVLIPAGAVLMFLLNAARVAALVLIGNAGARQIAMGGFHSQAGWILFNVVAVGMCVAVRRIPWLTTRPPGLDRHQAWTENPTAAYLVPLLMVLAAGMIAGAATGAFEWLYPLRFFAAVGSLWVFRRSYREINWRFGWLAFAQGALVFVIWIAYDRIVSSGAAAGAPAALMSASAGSRTLWIVFRVLGAVVTVPLVEELAFRGFLLRRFVSADFEAVPYQRLGWFALLASSAVFGVLHGAHWPAGIIAGLVFSWAVMRKGRMGDAVAAHATANLLLCGYVLFFGHWSLW